MYKIKIFKNKLNSDLSFFDLKKSLELEEAKSIVQKLHKQNVMAWFFPEEYFNTDTKFIVRVKLNKEHIDLDTYDLSKPYTFDEAQKLSEELKKQNVVVDIYLEAYNSPKITMEEAIKTAQTIYNKAVSEKPKNYSELEISLETPIYYSFCARNFELEAEGCVPGKLFIYIDKISGKEMPYSKISEYLDLNESF